jgi:penicillin-binding protein 2
VTGLAGLRCGFIESRDYSIDCTGVFDRYFSIDGSKTNCWFYTLTGVGHGPLNLVEAIENSCNVFFLVTGALIGNELKVLDTDEDSNTYGELIAGDIRDGAEYLGEVTKEFGLGVPTGIELRENTGILSTPSARRERLGIAEGDDYDRTEIDAMWYVNETAQTAFGQGDSKFSTLQLANYAATIGNGGNLYDLTILYKVVSSNFVTVREKTPSLRHTIPESDYIALLQEGMLRVSTRTSGTAYKEFGNYEPQVASKTGTAQVGGDTNEGAFVSYAPADNPEIAIAVNVEKGGSGSAIMKIAAMIYDYHFQGEGSVRAVAYGDLIP